MAQSTVANKIRLSRIPKKQQEQILNGGLTERHARSLLRITDDQKREEAIEEIIRRKLNVSQTERYVEGLLNGKTRRRRIPVVKDVRIFLNTINKALEVMKNAGIQAEAEKKDDGSCIEYICSNSQNVVIKIQQKGPLHSEAGPFVIRPKEMGQRQKVERKLSQSPIKRISKSKSRKK